MSAFAQFYESLEQMTLLAEEGQPYGCANSKRSRRLKREGLDRGIVVRAHEEFRLQMAINMSAQLCSVTTSLGDECPTASAPLSSLKVITLPQLIVGKRHHGRVLHGRLCVKPFKMSAILSVLEDENGACAARLAVYNVLPGSASAEEAEDRFPVGMRVIVKEPFFKLCVDGKTAIRVDNPADIALDPTWKDETENWPLLAKDKGKLVEELETIRCEGNELFGGQDWSGAVKKYSRCIDKAMSRMGTKITTEKVSMLSKFNNVVMLAYSNRAEARLRLRAFEDALKDANAALEFDPQHVKTLVRKGKALHGMGLFEKSVTIFKAALDRSPEEQYILSNLKASTTAYEQSRTGNYDLSAFYSRGCTGDIPPCADFVGPVEIGRVHYGGYGRRGLFATKKVEPGQVLLVCNPLAIVRQKSDLRELNFDYKWEEAIPVCNSGIQQDFVVDLTNQIMKSKRQMAQLYCLASYGKKHEMEIPSMDLFRPGSEWVPPGTEKLEVDMGLIRGIAKVNASGDNVDNLVEVFSRIGKGDKGDKVSSGIWLLPSFANHSCAPNCLTALVGDAMFVRSAVDIEEGEELTISYFSEGLFENVETRQVASQNWFFTCKCERCLFEESLKPQLSKVNKALGKAIGKAIPKLDEAVETANLENGQKRRVATEELAKVVSEVEAVIQSLNTKLKPRQQSWIRAAFLCSYTSKFRLAVEEELDSQAKIASHRLILDSMASVSVSTTVLEAAANLLREVEQRYPKHTHSYRLTLDRVLGIYRVAFGKQPNNVLQKLIRARKTS